MVAMFDWALGPVVLAGQSILGYFFFSLLQLTVVAAGPVALILGVIAVLETSLQPTQTRAVAVALSAVPVVLVVGGALAWELARDLPDELPVWLFAPLTVFGFYGLLSRLRGDSVSRNPLTVVSDSTGLRCWVYS